MENIIKNVTLDETNYIGQVEKIFDNNRIIYKKVHKCESDKLGKNKFHTKNIRCISTQNERVDQTGSNGKLSSQT